MYAGIPLISSIIVVIPQAQIFALKLFPASEAKTYSWFDSVSMRQNYAYRFDIATYLSSRMQIAKLSNEWSVIYEKLFLLWSLISRLLKRNFDCY